MTVVQQWQIAPPAPESHLVQSSHMPRAVAQVLFNRGLGDFEKAERFLDGQYHDDNPFRLKGVGKAVTLVRQTIRQAHPIAIYGDFDADGVTSTALLVETLRSLGADVRPYIPHRVDEGYGLRVEALDELADQGVRLVITADCGIRAVEQVAHAVESGLEIIVTDHHSIGSKLPPASVVINPRQPDCAYPFKELAGVGIAFKLAQALLRAHLQVPIVPGAVGLGEDFRLSSSEVAGGALVVDQNVIHLGAFPKPRMEGDDHGNRVRA